jgi:hypothetical protein
MSESSADRIQQFLIRAMELRDICRPALVVFSVEQRHCW